MAERLWEVNKSSLEAFGLSEHGQPLVAERDQRSCPQKRVVPGGWVFNDRMIGRSLNRACLHTTNRNPRVTGKRTIYKIGTIEYPQVIGSQTIAGEWPLSSVRIGQIFQPDPVTGSRLGVNRKAARSSQATGQIGQQVGLVYQ